MKTKILTAGVSLMFAALAPSVHADEQAAASADSAFYVSPMFNYIGDVDERYASGAFGGTLAVGKFFGEHLGAELSYFNNRFDPSDAGAIQGPEWRESGLELSGLYVYTRKYCVVPYFTAGIGWARTQRDDLNDRDSNDLFWDAGLGLLHKAKLFGYPIELRADARARVLNLDDSVLVDHPANGGLVTRDFDDRLVEPVLRLGVIVPIGIKAAPAVAPVPVAAPAPAVPTDTDGDGVLDTSDKCPGTAKGTKVDEMGCVPVAAPAHKFESVRFPYNKSTLTDRAKLTLNTAAKEIGALQKANPKVTVDVAGHTDSRGTDTYNQALSERRASIVKDYLAGKGIDATSISTQALGETQPVASNDTDVGRDQNRRAEITAGE